MGIKNLNRYLRENCPNSINRINMSELSGKRIAVDISIYLYKYETDGCLLENMYMMLSIFRHNNIIPIFIFDGKPPPEKRDILIKRKEDRETALNLYDKLKIQLNTTDVVNTQNIVSRMEQLKKKTVQITAEKIYKVKALIVAYGATYYDAPREADELCANLVIHNVVWACLSEDMDLFVYGCSRVIRYFSLLGHTAVLYCMKSILTELDINQQNFKDICILSGTDYGSQFVEKQINFNLIQSFNYFKQFKNDNLTKLLFYDWVSENITHIHNIKSLTHIANLFDLNTNNECLCILNNTVLTNKPINQGHLETIMEEVDFIFV